MNRAERYGWAAAGILALALMVAGIAGVTL